MTWRQAGDQQTVGGTVRARSLGRIGLSVIAIGQGLTYTFRDGYPLPYGLQKFSTAIDLPIQPWGILWLIVGTMCLIAALLRRPGWNAVAGIVFLLCVWGGGNLWGAIQFWAADYPGPWTVLGATVYLGFAAYVMTNVPKSNGVHPNSPNPSPVKEAQWIDAQEGPDNGLVN